MNQTNTTGQYGNQSYIYGRKEHTDSVVDPRIVYGTIYNSINNTISNNYQMQIPDLGCKVLRTGLHWKQNDNRDFHKENFLLSQSLLIGSLMELVGL